MPALVTQEEERKEHEVKRKPRRRPVAAKPSKERPQKAEREKSSPKLPTGTPRSMGTWVFAPLLTLREATEVDKSRVTAALGIFWYSDNAETRVWRLWRYDQEPQNVPADQ